MNKRDSQAPVKMGDRFESMRSGDIGEVIEVQFFGAGVGWAARLQMKDRSIHWITCSRDGLKGYRRISP